MTEDEVVVAFGLLLESLRFDLGRNWSRYAYVAGQRVDLRELWVARGDDGAWARRRWNELVGSE